MNVITTKQGLELSGKLIYATVLEVDNAAKKLLEHHQSQLISIDCKHVTKLDSAGIALLIDWKRWCNNHKKQFQIINANNNAAALITSYKLRNVLALVE